MPGSLPGNYNEQITKTTFIIHRNNHVIQDEAGCEGWTWTDEENALLSNNCLMFSNLGEKSAYPHCVRKESIQIQSDGHGHVSVNSIVVLSSR